MLIYENIRLAFSSLIANKMRALLTMLGIIIGISSVIAIMTVGNSVTQDVTEQMASIGANNITVSLQVKEDEKESTKEGMRFGDGGGKKTTLLETDYISREMLEEYVDTYSDSIMAISGSRSVGEGQVLDGNLYANITLNGVSTGYFVANNTKILTGRFFSENELNDSKMVAIVSDKFVNNMFKGVNEDAIGKEVVAYIGDKMYKLIIVGVYEYENSAYSFSTTSEKDTSTECYIPLRTAQKLTHMSGYTNFTVVTNSGVNSDDFTATTESFFNRYYRNNRNWQISAFSMASMVDMMTEMLGTITTAISVIAGIALLVGGIGVMNIMLVSITERTREIGTRKALGAPNSSIRLQFIVEAIVICIVGGIIGILIGVFAGIKIAQAMGSPASPSVSSILLSLGFSMAIGVFFGYYPANKAAKMDPIEALRYE